MKYIFAFLLINIYSYSNAQDVFADSATIMIENNNVVWRKTITTIATKEDILNHLRNKKSIIIQDLDNEITGKIKPFKINYSEDKKINPKYKDCELKGDFVLIFEDNIYTIYVKNIVIISNPNNSQQFDIPFENLILNKKKKLINSWNKNWSIVNLIESELFEFSRINSGNYIDI